MSMLTEQKFWPLQLCMRQQSESKLLWLAVVSPGTLEALVPLERFASLPHDAAGCLGTELGLLRALFVRCLLRFVLGLGPQDSWCRSRPAGCSFVGSTKSSTNY